MRPAPNRDSQRRRRNRPASYGAAEPTTAPAADRALARDLGIDNPHPLIASMWDTVQSSCESRFYSDSDWARLRFELWFANRAMCSGRPVSGHTWAAIQHGLNEMLLSPAIKRRASIELKRPGVDADAVAADEQIARYKTVLKSV
jgi:hypothetical protein